MKRNYSTFNESTTVELGKLTFNDALELIDWLKGETEWNDGRLTHQHRAEEAEEMVRRTRENSARLLREAELHTMVEEWLEACQLKPGTYVKMKGCRDGRGIRIVLSVKFRKDDRSIIECRQVKTGRKWLGGPGNARMEEETLGQITKHLSDKISQVKVGEVWYPIRPLVEAFHKQEVSWDEWNSEEML